MKIVTVKQMQALERAAENAGVSTDTLMENAGLALTDIAIGQLSSPRGTRVVVLVGAGNNGGDGLVAARRLQQWGARVYVYLCAPRKSPDPKLDLAVDRGIPVMEASNDTGLSLLQQHLASCSLVIDAVLGTGRARPIEGQLKDILLKVSAACEERHIPLIAVDLPTGLDADTGALDPACPRADVTAALAYPKVGHLTFPGASAVGQIKVVDIGIPKGLDADINLEMMTPDLARRLLPQRSLNSHKGAFGRLLVVAGSRSYVGATYLACSGAYRVGAGLVTLATAQGVYRIAATTLAEATHLPLSETESGGIGSQALETVQESLTSYDTLIIGCGLGQADETIQFVQQLALDTPTLANVPLVLDADALNSLAQCPDWHERLKSPSVLTPHPGEMARLMGMTTSQVQDQRLSVAEQSAAHWNQVVVLKGAHTIVASPEGMSRISPFANPGLASAGTGDVLAGIIGGLLVQGLSPFDAATCGVYLHAAAGEALRRHLGDAGLMASDLLPELPKQIKTLKEE